MCFSFLELAPWNFRVDEPEEVSSDVVEISSMSQLLVLLIFLKKLLKLAKKCSLSDFYQTDSNEDHLSRGVLFLYALVINKMKHMRCTFILKNFIKPLLPGVAFPYPLKTENL